MEQRAIAAGAVLCLLALGAVGGVAAGSVAENSSVALQESGTVAVDSDIETGGEVELLVELADEGPIRTAETAGTETTVARLQERAAVSQSGVRTFAAQTPGVTVENRFWLTNTVLVRLDTDRVPVRALARIEGVEAITRNTRVRALDSGLDAKHSSRGSASSATAPAGTASSATASADSAASATAPTPATTYGLAQIDAPEVWSRYDTRGAGANVTVLDTGIDPGHPDLALANWSEFDGSGTELDTQPQDYGSHGTHVSGTVAGGNESGEYVGVAPAANLSHGAVLTDCGSDGCFGTSSQIIAGMQWAVANDADVLSMSIVCQGYCTWPVDAVRNAESAGTTVVAAIGNNGEGTSSSPGNVYDSISVGASDSNEDIASFSSGEQIDTDSAWPVTPPSWPDQYVVPGISAPGASVKSTEPGGTYGYKSGTSMATPHVSGAIALAESVIDRPLAPDEIERALERTAWKPESWSEPGDQRDTRYGYGIIDAPALVEYLLLTANFSIDRSIAAPGESVTFDATSAVGNVSEYRWDFDGDGRIDATTTDPVTTHAYSATGQQTPTLTVVNATGGTNTTSGTLTVSAPPTAALAATPTTLETGETVAFDAGNSTGDIAEYRWDFDGDGTVERATSDPVTTRTYSESGQQTPTVTVVETDSQTDRASTTLTVETPLTAAFDRSPLEPETGEEVTFVASDSTGDIAEYRWDFDGDGSVDATRTEGFVTHTYTEGGQQTVTLTVTDGAGETAQTSKTLTVKQSAQFAVAIESTTAPVVAGEPLSVDVQVSNTGDLNGTQTIQLDAGPLGTNATTVSLAGNTSTTVTVGVSTSIGDYGTQTLTVSSANDTASSSVSVSMQTLAEGPPADPNGDGLYEDVRGDGNVSTLDVQALFDYLHSDVVRTNSAAFNFQDFDSEVNILDVQVLFKQV